VLFVCVWCFVCESYLCCMYFVLLCCVNIYAHVCLCVCVNVSGVCVVCVCCVRESLCVCVCVGTVWM